MRKLIIFGNGLGRALNNDFFNLERALQQAWDDPFVLTVEQKQLIIQCLPDEVLERDLNIAPKSEDELDRLQRVLAACDEIRKYEIDGGPSWLTQHGAEFPSAIRSYVHRAASNFHEGAHALPSDFVDGLITDLKTSKSHIATLNYDELLYRSFVGTAIFSGYGCLIDGFVPTFDKGHLDRRYPGKQSFYLHLHGSPLYFSDNSGGIQKSGMGGLAGLQGYSSTHLVLTHAVHKTSVINASPVLREYWSRLVEAMQEVDGIVLFGYGGGDSHLNQLIRTHFVNKQIEVVERRHKSYETEPGRANRLQFWANLLGKAPNCFWHDNILHHKYWSWVGP